MNINVRIEWIDAGVVSGKLDTILAKLNDILAKEIMMAGELEALTTQVAANTDAEQSAVILLTKLHELLVAAGTDPAKLTDLKNQLAASRDKLAEAIVAGTPAENTPEARARRGR